MLMLLIAMYAWDEHMLKRKLRLRDAELATQSDTLMALQGLTGHTVVTGRNAQVHVCAGDTCTIRFDQHVVSVRSANSTTLEIF